MAAKPGELLLIDISQIKTVLLGGQKFWAIVEDNNMGFTWSFFVKKKNEQNNFILSLLKELQKEVKIISVAEK